MKTETVIQGLCARCGTELMPDDTGLKFFLPAPKTNGNVKSCECCLDCFKAFVESPPNELVEMRFDRPVLKDWQCARCGARQRATMEPEYCSPLDQGGCDRRGGMLEEGKTPLRW
jgi:hypothetical protein